MATNFRVNLPVVTKNLLIINLICWLATIVARRWGVDLNALLGLHYLFSGLHFWQPFTYMFMHANFEHLFFNMFAVWMFAPPIEQRWGSQRFLTYYLVTGVGAAVVQELVWLAMYGAAPVPALTIGASGAVFGILFAFGWLFPDVKMFLLFVPIPISARVFVGLYALVELFAGIASVSGDNVAHFAHLGGMLFGWLLLLWWRHQNKEMFSSEPYESRLKAWWQRQRAKRGERSRTQKVRYHYQDPIRTDSQQDEKTDAERETDRILDKIKKSGYDSLTEEEKQHIFRK